MDADTGVGVTVAVVVYWVTSLEAFITDISS